MDVKIFAVCVVVAIISRTDWCVGDGNICCAPDQFEGIIVYDNGNVFIDADTAYSYINATIKTAYDATNRRTYMDVTSVELSPLIPKPVKSQVTFINDYAKGVQYQFHGEECDKSAIGPFHPQCIPGNAVRMSTGFIGNKEKNVLTYSYTRPDSPYAYTATIDPDVCLPAHLLYTTLSSVPDSGTLNSLQLSDVTKGIKDPSIFTPPKSCNSSLYHAKKEYKTNRKLTVFKDLSLSLPFCITK